MGKRLVFVIMLIGLSGLCGQAPSGYVVTAYDVKTRPSPENTLPQMKDDVFYVTFRATLRNTSNHPMFVSAEPIMSAIPEILLPSGKWKPMMLSKDVFETADQKYPPCTRLDRGKTFVFPKVSDIVFLAKDRPPNDAATIRFPFYSECMVGSARRSTGFITEGLQNYRWQKRRETA